MLYYVLFVTVSLILVQKLGVIYFDQINKRVGFCESQDYSPCGTTRSLECRLVIFSILWLPLCCQEPSTPAINAEGLRQKGNRLVAA